MDQSVEKKQLANLDKHQKRYLSHRGCGLCEHPLDQTGCGAIYDPCGEQVRVDRRIACLAEYKPRPERRSPK